MAETRVYDSALILIVKDTFVTNGRCVLFMYFKEVDGKMVIEDFRDAKGQGRHLPNSLEIEATNINGSYVDKDVYGVMTGELRNRNEPAMDLINLIKDKVQIIFQDKNGTLNSSYVDNAFINNCTVSDMLTKFYNENRYDLKSLVTLEYRNDNTLDTKVFMICQFKSLGKEDYTGTFHLPLLGVKELDTKEKTVRFTTDVNSFKMFEDKDAWNTELLDFRNEVFKDDHYFISVDGYEDQMVHTSGMKKTLAERFDILVVNVEDLL